MDLNELERRVQKCKSLYVVEADPALIFVFDSYEDAENAYIPLVDYFGQVPITLFIRYNTEFLKVSIADHIAGKMINIGKVSFEKPEHFRLIKPMANQIDESPDSKKPVLLLAVKYNKGFRPVMIKESNATLGEVNKIVTRLVQHE